MTSFFKQKRSRISPTRNALQPHRLFVLSIMLGMPFMSHADTKVVPANEVEWGYLNPLRGDKSPGAADLWGDRTQDTATGMLVRFNKGFESPPHIHNITYRGIVIEGQMHNDDPSAAKMWMPTGSFWTQPAGEDHTTAANDSTNLIYLEIDEGPYLVKPSNAHFDNGERPVNLHINNMVWLHDSDLATLSAEGVKATYLWGDTQDVFGSMLFLPAGFNGTITAYGQSFKAVVIKGAVNYTYSDAQVTQHTAMGSTDSDEGNKTIALGAGSFLESTGESQHKVNIRVRARYLFIFVPISLSK